MTVHGPTQGLAHRFAARQVAVPLRLAIGLISGRVCYGASLRWG